MRIFTNLIQYMGNKTFQNHNKMYPESAAGKIDSPGSVWGARVKVLLYIIYNT